MFGKSKMYWQRTFEGYIFIGPWLIGFVIFTAGALLGSFGISLSKWSMIGTPQYVGLENYKYMVNDRFSGSR